MHCSLKPVLSSMKLESLLKDALAELEEVKTELWFHRKGAELRNEIGYVPDQEPCCVLMS